MYETILLLQGPVGPLFRWLKKEFEQSGHRVYKIDFNLGDQPFYSSGIPCRQCEKSFCDYVKDFLKTKGVTKIYLYGDCRPLHRIVIEIANDLSVPVNVVEDGYMPRLYNLRIRPRER